MDLNDYRLKIDAIDKELLRLFSERMDVASEIARFKAENGLPVLDSAREREQLLAVADAVAPALQDLVLS